MAFVIINKNGFKTMFSKKKWWLPKFAMHISTYTDAMVPFRCLQLHPIGSFIMKPFFQKIINQTGRTDDDEPIPRLIQLNCAAAQQLSSSSTTLATTNAIIITGKF
jgi:hypothetical protein